MLEVIFLTSNDVKIAHARYLCRNYDIYISKQKHYGISYKEPRIFDREKLLDESINDAYKRLSKYSSALDDKFFFIEDTSVIITALSKDQEYPGVDIKYWMRENNFQTVDKILKSHRNDRSVEVRSDIVLMLPHNLMRLLKIEKRSKKFTSKIKGHITDEELSFPTQPLYSWLDNKTFNKWFVPEECKTVISLLPIDTANKYDFRFGAFQQMLTFLESHNLIKKTASSSFVENSLNKNSFQRQLFNPPPLFIICGFTCAGKTTLATYIADNYEYYHLEASDYMYLSYYRTHGAETPVKVGDFAEKALEEYPNIVVDQIINDIDDLGSSPIVITGFRSIQEIEGFKQQYRGDSQIVVIFIEAEADIRFDRCVERSRFDKHKNRTDFDRNDLQQTRMGLTSIGSQVTNRISNNQTIEKYYKAFEDYYSHLIDISRNSTSILEIRKIDVKGLEDEIILSLYSEFGTEEYFTTTEISKLINSLFHNNEKGKSKNNVSRYFNQYYYPYYEIQIVSNKRKYRLSQSGVSHAQWLMRNYTSLINI